jgi:RecB family exonuclease
MGYNLPRKYFSASQFNKYMNCPQAYYRDYILDEEPPERLRSTALSIGSSVHYLSEVFIKAQLALKETTPEDVIASTNLDDFFEDTDLEGLPPEYWVEQSQILFKVWYKGMGNILIPTASEFGFDSLVGDVPVKGFIDYIDNSSGVTEIVDLKVTKKAKSQLDAKNSAQLAIYAITQKNPCVRFDSVVRSKNPRGVSTRYTFSASELGYFTDLVGEVATNISKGNFPMANPTNWICSEKWCQHYAECRGKIR